MKSPCKDCARRKVGCHNVDTCREWREYVEANQAAQARRRDNTEKGSNWQEHLRRRGYPTPMR